MSRQFPESLCENHFPPHCSSLIIHEGVYRNRKQVLKAYIEKENRFFGLEEGQ